MSEEKLVYLAFHNKEAPPSSDREMLACRSCRNKTFTARADMGQFPELYFAACGGCIGAFGWTEQVLKDRP